MDNSKQIVSAISFYGNTHIPLSIECSGCHYFNYECEGSVNRGGCPTGQVTNINPSLAAGEILEDSRVVYNYFLLARICGSDLNEKWYKDHLNELTAKIAKAENTPGKEDYVAALKVAVKEYETALNLDESTIQNIQEDFDAKDRLFVPQPKPETAVSPEEPDDTSYPLDNDDSLPF